jgi:hypothetical protein
MYYWNPGATSASNVETTFLRVIDSVQPVMGSWHFDEGLGATAYDTSGKGHNAAVVNGPAWVDGKFGKALSFDGNANQYVEHSYDPDFTPGTKSWTVAAWARADSGSVDRTIVSWYRCGAYCYPTSEAGAIYSLGIDKNNKAYWRVRDDKICFGIPDCGIDITSPFNVTDNTWHFFVGTFDPSLDITKLYVDGQSVNSSYSPIISLSDPGFIPLEIGRDYRTGWGSPSSYFNGTMDEVRIYNRALSASEISDLYNNYGYTTLNYPGRVLVRKYASPEPTVTIP